MNNIKRTIIPYDIKVCLSINNIEFFCCKPTKQEIMEQLKEKEEYMSDDLIEAIVKSLDEFLIFKRRNFTGTPPMLEFGDESANGMLFYQKTFSKF